MKKIIRPFTITLYSVLLIAAAVFAILYPAMCHGQISPYSGIKVENLKSPSFDPDKKTVFVIADSKMTEMFDMLAPFNLFNTTGQLNVYIVAKDETPIPLKKDLYVLPQMTFSQVKSKQLNADVIVIPAMSARDENQDTAIINFIKTQCNSNTRLISICDGSTTAAATGFYDGHPITTHATDFECVKKHFNKPRWVQNVTVTKSGNLYSTAGVANAVEGSLQVIQDLLGGEASIKAAREINYPHDKIQLSHNSVALSFGNKMSILKKMVLSKKKKLGLLLHEGMDELRFASIVDTYGRTYPKEFKTFTLQDSVLTTRYGLTFIHTGGNAINPKMDEVHVIMPEALTQSDADYFKGFELVKQSNSLYSIDQCLSRIQEQFGAHYAHIVKVTLDYN